MTDMTDKAVAWIKYQKALTPDRPSFIYFAPGATHAPHHVPQEWIARWKGKFDQGWDKLREETLARQVKMGIVPPGTKLAPKPEATQAGHAMETDMVDQLVAKNAFLANLAVFKTGDQMLGALQVIPREPALAAA